MNNWEGNTLLYQSAGTDSQHRTFLPVPPPSDCHVNRTLKVSHCDTYLGHSISYNHEKNKFQTLNTVFSVITIFGKKVNRSPEVNGQCPGYFYTTIMR